jgi:hypothetical protein
MVVFGQKNKFFRASENDEVYSYNDRKGDGAT